MRVAIILTFYVVLAMAALAAQAEASMRCDGSMAVLDPRLSLDGGSIAGISVLEGPNINLWSAVESQGRPDSLVLQLDPNNPVVIGRAQGGRPPYLAAGYTATAIMPQGGNVLNGGMGDQSLSRAHFQLRGTGNGGIVIVNGVPSVGGGLRAPKNGTRLLAPQDRWLGPNEEYVVEAGTSARLRLPNGTVLLISAH